ncbi:MAG: Crp/Fnr family transcriptional regulator [Sphingosinicella sp.]|nr:Crp/Fnr family transcriptional regulator [Sphingosinicella sp.]
MAKLTGPLANKDTVSGSDPLHELLLKLRARDVLSEEEEQILRDSIGEIKELPRAKVIVKAGVTVSECTLLVEGFVCRYKDLSDGQRQLMELHVPGDFLDLHSFLLKQLEHNVGSMTPVRLVMTPHDKIRDITEKHPHLARMLWFSTLLDAAIHRERILSVGRRSALSRISHLFCELYVRLNVVGLTDGFSYRLPITQADIADASGLTAVHVNRMLKQLREMGLMSFRNNEVVIQDWNQLQRTGEFSDHYLYLERRPR